MSREVHVRFCEGLGVKIPRATHRNIYVQTPRAGQRVLPHLMRDNSDDLGWGAPGCESPTTGQISLAVDRICSSTEGL